MPSEQEKEDSPDWWQCGRCEDWFHRYVDRMRRWARGYWVETPEGVETYYSNLCNDCHRELGLH